MIAFINFLACKVLFPFINLKGSTLVSTWFNVSKPNKVSISGTMCKKSRFIVQGKKNQLIIKDSLVSDSIITISGDNNEVVFEEGVKFRKGNLIIRGNSCRVVIGKGTTFGGVRIINVGSKNDINIGANCLFSDYIEIWASDTHSIYNENDDWINKEAPITIGDNVWVGSRVNILKGITIGDGAIIGLGSLVTKDVPARVIAAGSPTRVVKEGVKWSLDYNFEEL